jgi:MFS family permease
VPSRAAANSRLGGRERRALLAGVGLIIAGALPSFLTASLAPRIQVDFAFGESVLGLTIAAFYVVSALFSTPSGRLVERIGGERGMQLAAATTAVSCLAVAGLAQSAASLVALLVIGGVGNALAGPAVSALLRREIAGHRHGLAFGAQQSGAPLGALLAGLALPLVAIPFGWRWAFLIAAALGLVAAARAPAGGVAPASASERVRPKPGLGAVHALALVAVLASAAGVGFISFLVLYAVDSGMSESAAGLLLGAVSLGATVSRIAMGLLADRRGQEPLGPAAFVLAASVVGYVLLIAGSPPTVVVGALLAGTFGWSWPGALTLAVIQRSPEAPAWAVGVMMSGLFVGAVGGPLIVGLLADSGMFAGAWILCAGLALLAATTIVATRRLEERHRAG